jgi:hypothetical protein
MAASKHEGGFNNALGRLRTLELVHGRGELRASYNPSMRGDGFFAFYLKFGIAPLVARNVSRSPADRSSLGSGIQAQRGGPSDLFPISSV